MDGTPPGETGTVPQQLCDQDLAGSGEQEEQEQEEGLAPPRPRPACQALQDEALKTDPGDRFIIFPLQFFLVLNKNYLLP